jgi:hypothetical protein
MIRAGLLVDERSCPSHVDPTDAIDEQQKRHAPWTEWMRCIGTTTRRRSNTVAVAMRDKEA